MSLSWAIGSTAPCIRSSRSSSFAAPPCRKQRAVRCSADVTKQAQETDQSIILESSRNYAHAGFPPGFKFGAASAAYQVEGATKKGGRGPSIWDTFCEEFPEKIDGGGNGDPGAGSYYYYQEDVQLLKELGANVYRFSISWSRILPNGHGEPNEEGILYYKKLIDELLRNGIVPFVTIFHWDVPQKLDEEYGSFLSEKIVDDFKHFADICFKNFGDKVKHWISLNEPSIFSNLGYSLGIFAPGHCTPGLEVNGKQYICPDGDSIIEPYVVGHNLLKAHAAVVELYRHKYQPLQGGKIGITVVSNWFVPFTDSPLDLQAQKRALEFNLGWFLDPLKFGDYPFSMKSLVRERLPKFTKEESEKLKNSYDFIGVNYYTSTYVKNKDFELNFKPEVCSQDSRVELTGSKDGIPIGYAQKDSWVYVYPRGLRELLLYIKDRYNNPEIYITENGVLETKNDDLKALNHPIPIVPNEELMDTYRSQYHSIHLHELGEAMRLGVNLKGYFVWSLLDSFEWKSGYTSKFGLTHVNLPFNPEKRHKRVPKQSFQWYKWFISIAKTPLLQDGNPDAIAEGHEEVKKEVENVKILETPARFASVN